MGPRVEKDHKPRLRNKKQSQRAGGDVPKYKKLNLKFNDWDRDGI